MTHFYSLARLGSPPPLRAQYDIDIVAKRLLDEYEKVIRPVTPA